jgi:hypothetical protein
MKVSVVPFYYIVTIFVKNTSLQVEMSAEIEKDLAFFSKMLTLPNQLSL